MCSFEPEMREINKAAEASAEDFVFFCEDEYKKRIDSAVERIQAEKGRGLVMLAGPSSSGKTTTAKIICEKLRQGGRPARIVSLDDFYFDQAVSFRFEDGTPDFETIRAVDIDFAVESLNRLMDGGQCMLPRFSFITKKREPELYRAKLEENEIIVTEGLHAINPLLTDRLCADFMLKIYVSVSSRVRNDGEILLSKRNLRFIRRMIRDEKFRNADVEYTMMLWKGVLLGEDRYIFPYKDLADIKINSFHAYEPCVFQKNAVKLLDRVGSSSVYFDEAQKIVGALSLFKSIPAPSVPKNSLLREFIG